MGIPPERWPATAKSAILTALSMLRAAFTTEVARRLDGDMPVSRDIAEIARLQAENANLKDELALLRSRFSRLKGANRPHYRGPERLAILELKARMGWSAKQTAEHMLLDEETVSAWGRLVNEDGSDALLVHEPPVNKFPDVVDRVVATACAGVPDPSKREVAEYLARQGLHISPSTVGRKQKALPAKGPKPPEPSTSGEESPRTVTAKYPNHVWNADLTTVPIAGGFCSAFGVLYWVHGLMALFGGHRSSAFYSS